MSDKSHADVVIIVSANLSRSGEGGARYNIRCMCKTMLNGLINSTAMNERVNTCAPSNPLPPGEVRTYGAMLMQKNVMNTSNSKNLLYKIQKILAFIQYGNKKANNTNERSLTILYISLLYIYFFIFLKCFYVLWKSTFRNVQIQNRSNFFLSETALA